MGTMVIKIKIEIMLIITSIKMLELGVHFKSKRLKTQIQNLKFV